MMHGPEQSDPAIVAGKPANKAVPTAAEPVEPRGRGQGERAPAKHAPDTVPETRVTSAGARTASFAVTHPRREPCAGIPLARIWAGGGQ